MMKNIAVVLRGHIRTWDYNAPVVFDFFDSISENVDYYVATWRTPSLKMQTIERAFETAGKEISAKIIMNIDENFYTSWNGPALLATMVAPNIRHQHLKTPYDAVFETRFDVLSTRNHDIPITPIAENTWYTNCFTNLVDRYGDRNVGMKDHFLAGTVETYSAMADRLLIPACDTKECHVDMLQFAQGKGIKVSNSLNWVNTMMSRPSDRFRVADAFTWKNPWNVDVNQEFPHWENATVEERIDMLVRMDIEWADYITDNGNIGVGRPRTALSPELEEYKRRLDAGESMMGLTDLNFD
jgi:hypothetical protein|tara:strand:+ start:66 stop:959 length:894 start_codon:yes stop_codon:yes gene_type:complete